MELGPRSDWNACEEVRGFELLQFPLACCWLLVLQLVPCPLSIPISPQRSSPPKVIFNYEKKYLVLLKVSSFFPGSCLTSQSEEGFTTFL
jgi:hypothetical protein